MEVVGFGNSAKFFFDHAAIGSPSLQSMTKPPSTEIDWPVT
jgi:hypothetical protein